MACRPFALLFAVGLLVLAAPPATATTAETPKTIILGFDGMDHALTQQFMDEGLLPNLKRLAEQGTFAPLEPANPPESPVSWAVFNTGQNPGKTGIESFIARSIVRDDAGKPVPGRLPQPGSPLLGVKTQVELAPPSALGTFATERPQAFAGGVGAAALIVAFALVRFLFRGSAPVALVLGLAAGGVGYWQAGAYAAHVPAMGGTVPWEINPMQGTHWWKHLDAQGVRVTGIQAAQTYPPDSEGPNTRLLSGLGVKDISGSPGKYFVYTDDPWVIEDGTSSGGKIERIFFDEEDGARARAALPGPENWVEEGRFAQRIAALEAATNDSSHTAQELERIQRELDDVKSEQNKWRRKGRIATVDFAVTVDREAGKATFALDGNESTVSVGGWTEFMRVRFPFDEKQGASGLVRFHLLRCDKEEVRIFVPPVNIDPYDPPHIPISSPPDFCTELAGCIGEAYETLGWACMTNPLKDMAVSGFEIQSFMDDIGFTMNKREMILQCQLDEPSAWDVYFQLFSTTDRIGHMLMREFDTGHPEHDPAYAAKEVTCWGRTFPLSRALPEIYMQVDRIVGGVMERIERGEFGPDCVLMLVADHGFTSFRREVNLNNLLHEFGYLVLKKPGESLRGKGLGDIDWDRTRAYSIGLGKVYVNKLGREGTGIVTDAEYAGLCASIKEDLLSVTDGEGGVHPISEVWHREEIFSGDWVVENEGGLEYKFMHDRTQPVGPYDGVGDLFVGFAPYYRISWGTGFGGLEAQAISNNKGHWSGDHVSVNTKFVPGIFFSNRKLEGEADCDLIDIGPTVVSRYGIDVSATDMDGKVLPLAGVGR